MKLHSRPIRATGLGIMLLLVGGFGLRGADLQVGDDFCANESIEFLTARIQLGAGDERSEAVARDLGLRFLLGLHPFGHEDGENAPFGATPQRADVAHTARAHLSATFTLNPTADPGVDVRQTCSQLLSGVRIRPSAGLVS